MRKQANNALPGNTSTFDQLGRPCLRLDRCHALSRAAQTYSTNKLVIHADIKKRQFVACNNQHLDNYPCGAHMNVLWGGSTHRVECRKESTHRGLSGLQAGISRRSMMPNSSTGHNRMRPYAGAGAPMPASARDAPLPPRARPPSQRRSQRAARRATNSTTRSGSPARPSSDPSGTPNTVAGRSAGGGRGNPMPRAWASMRDTTAAEPPSSGPAPRRVVSTPSSASSSASSAASATDTASTASAVSSAASDSAPAMCISSVASASAPAICISSVASASAPAICISSVASPSAPAVPISRPKGNNRFTSRSSPPDSRTALAATTSESLSAPATDVEPAFPAVWPPPSEALPPAATAGTAPAGAADATSVDIGDSRWLWARLPQLAVKSATASPTRAVPRAFHQSGAERAWLTRRPPRRAPASRSAPAVASRRHDRCCRLLPAAAAAAYAESLAAALARPLARRAAAPASAPRRPRAGGADAARPALRMPQRARGALLSPRLAPSTAAARAAAVHAAGQHPPRDARCRLNRAAATAAN
eukprot:358299-Chlamydomonas_euryale.AAC.3